MLAQQVSQWIGGGARRCRKQGNYIVFAYVQCAPLAVNCLGGPDFNRTPLHDTTHLYSRFEYSSTGIKYRLFERNKLTKFSLVNATIIAGSLPLASLLTVLVVIDTSMYLIGICAFLLGGINFLIVVNVKRRADYQFQIIHTLIDGVMNGDYSYRGIAQEKDNEFTSLVEAINELASSLQTQRVTVEEKAHLLKKVVDYIDVAIVACDKNNMVHMLNPQAVRLLGLKNKDAIYEIGEELAITDSMNAGETHVVHTEFGNKHGQFRIHKESFISEGEAQNLLFITDVSNILRLEERKAWKNLMRVLAHEINNSVAPLLSFSNALMHQITKNQIERNLKDELLSGLSVIKNRAKSMANFVSRYKDVFVTPEPRLEYNDFKVLVMSVAQLFSDYNIDVIGEPVRIKLDSGLIEQALINFVKNGIESSQERLRERFEKEIKNRPCVTISWESNSDFLIVRIVDIGQGIINSENIFTPFYTTKASGSGVGLTISKQILELHGGHLDLQNNTEGDGCILTVTLPRP